MNNKEKKEWTLGRKLKLIIGIIATLLMVFVIFPQVFCGMALDYFWFESLGLESVFVTNITTWLVVYSAILAILVGVFFAIWRKCIKPALIKEIRREEREAKERRRDTGWKLNKLKEDYAVIKIIYSVPTVIASFVATYFLTSWFWFDILRYANRTSFGITDPIFSEDLGFYFFTLPLIGKILWVALILTLICIVMLLIINLLKGDRLEGSAPLNWRLSFFVLCIISALMAWFGRYSILRGEGDYVFGAGFTDIHVWLPYWYVLTIVLVLLGIGCLLWGRKREFSIKGISFGSSIQPLGIIFSVTIITFIFLIAAVASQGLVVGPSPLAKEGEYIDNEIDFTRYGFDLEDIEEKAYSGKAELNLSILESPSVKNIRIQDYKAVKVVTHEEQKLKRYYGFDDIDIDRYVINGEKSMLLIGTREMNQKGLPEKAKGDWLNERLIYTHGYGLTMCSVNELDKEGKPVFFLKDIPPISEVPEISISQPRIYYGEMTKDYIITNTGQKEFDYPWSREEGEGTEEQNIYLNKYPGSGGIRLTGIKKMVAGANIDWVKFFLSEYITDQSRLHLHRDIKERVEKITPFIYWDNDAYIFVDKNGATHWVLMGIVQSNECPYSESSKLGGNDVNYVRDSVKAIVDPLDGDITFYMIDSPLMRTYAKIYPELFKDISEMPEEYTYHLKYPEDLFDLKLEKFGIYHMKDRTDFYTKEDSWVRTKERYQGEARRVESYNQLLELEDETTFYLTGSMTPVGRNNMIAWIAVNQDVPNYGEFTCYKFSKGSLSYGPMQIEALIDQDKIISELMTLWGTEGSEVIRGNLLVIPIKNSLLYVEPIYISATINPIPAVKKIVSVYYDPEGSEYRVGIGDSLEESLINAINPELIPEKPESPEIPEETPKEIKEIISEFEEKFSQLMEDFFDQIKEAFTD